MTKEDAHAVLAFVTDHQKSVDVIFCQCEAGLSRSAGLAAALSRVLQEDDRYFFQRFAPNDWAYQSLLDASRQTRCVNLVQSEDELKAKYDYD